MSALAWQERAACRAYGSGDFFSDSQIRIRQAKRVCSVCPVRRQCLDMALRAEDQSRYGVFGGLTAAERQQLVKRTRAEARR
ncbi:WhiB family transcriptional regulator [Streptomyces sp. NPDC060235]|uniref:WhiB family transcriptional regulator n=1 Tax=Streptomyces sp. NPDC060235 TaxID=3347080 RepID=UPI00365E0681